MSAENENKDINSEPNVNRLLILNELERRIKWFHEMSKGTKGAEKKSYEDTCTSFVLFKMWVEKQ